MPGLPFVPAVEDTFIILPEACLIICLPTAMQQLKAPVRLTSIIRFHSSNGISSGNLGIAPPPALFIKISILPKCSVTFFTIAPTDSGSMISISTTNVFLLLSSFASPFNLSRSLLVRTTFAPALKNSRLKKVPIPPAAPVITATLFLRSNFDIENSLIGQHYAID